MGEGVQACQKMFFCRIYHLTCAPTAYNQSQILEAAATIVICSRLRRFTQLGENLKPVVDQGMLPEQVASAWVSAATQSHQDNVVLQRDEAFRSASNSHLLAIFYVSTTTASFSSSPTGGSKKLSVCSNIAGVTSSE